MVLSVENVLKLAIKAASLFGLKSASAALYLELGRSYAVRNMYLRAKTFLQRGIKLAEESESTKTLNAAQAALSILEKENENKKRKRF